MESATDIPEGFWKKIWRDENVINGLFVNDPTQRVPGFELPRAM